jgi:hypothetical protein
MLSRLLPGKRGASDDRAQELLPNDHSQAAQADQRDLPALEDADSAAQDREAELRRKADALGVTAVLAEVNADSAERIASAVGFCEVRLKLARTEHLTLALHACAPPPTGRRCDEFRPGGPAWARRCVHHGARPARSGARGCTARAPRRLARIRGAAAAACGGAAGGRAARGGAARG